MTRMSARLLVLLLLALTFACAKADDDLPPPPPPGEVFVDKIVLTTSSPTLPSAEEVIITASVRDQNGRVMQNVAVNFAANNNGSLEIIDNSTDQAGNARALLSTPFHKANRIITVTATAELITETIDIPVVGTTLAISGPVSAMLGDTAALEVTVRDSAGTGLSGVSVANDLNIVSMSGNQLTPKNPSTNTNGRVTIDVVVDNSTAVGGVTVDTISVSGMGATQASHTFNITTEYFNFITPDPDADSRPELNKGSNHQVTVIWTDNNIPVANGSMITLSTTRGDFVDGNFVISAGTFDGEATVEIISDSAGSATITAQSASGLVAKIDVLFVATEVDALALQAKPDVIGIKETSEIIAVVRDPQNNLVKNQKVFFKVYDEIGGSLEPNPVTTDEFGRATTYYKAGSQPSAHNGVTIEAQVGPLLETVPLTVAGKELFITLGFSDDIVEEGGLRYKKPSSVMVVDSAGHPVPNRKVTLAIWPTYYHKGYFFRDTSSLSPRWAQYATATSCPNEDINRNGILDDGEDYNNNGRLDPGGVATISTGTAEKFTVTTNNNGFADFEIVYFKQFAWWAGVEVTATISVDGTESTDKARFLLPVALSDITSETSLAGHFSPFGTSAQCDNNFQMTASPTQLSGAGAVTITMEDIVAGKIEPVAGQAVTVNIISNNPAFVVSATGGTTNDAGQISSNVTLTGGTSGDYALIYYEAGGASAIVVVSRP